MVLKKEKERGKRKMAITPQQAIGQKLVREQEAINQLEQKIDEHLRQSFDDRKTISIDVSAYSTFVSEEVKRRFEKAGWTVRRNAGDDQRDGSWDNLDFSAKLPI